MKILIPTAKEMNTEIPSLEAKPLCPESQVVLDELSRYSSQELENFYKISAEKTQEEYDHIHALENGTAINYPALHLFDGLMYRNIKRDNLTKAEQAYLEKHLMITSALYGVIPAFAPIAPHRLDFLMKLKIAGKSLKSHWQSAYEESVKGEELIFSLLSSEFETVFPKEVREQMVTFKFMEDRNGKLKVHSTISKKARGKMAAWMMSHDVQNKSELQKFNVDGFAFDASLSRENHYCFVKEV